MNWLQRADPVLRADAGENKINVVSVHVAFKEKPEGTERLKDYFRNM